MSAFSRNRNRSYGRRRRWIWLVVVIVPLLLLTGSSFATWQWYQRSIQPYDPANTDTVIVNILEGATEDTIGVELENKQLIRSSAAYRLFVRINRIEGSMQAGGYKLSPSMSVSEIVDIFRRGEVAVDLVTILPASRLDQIEKSFKESGYTDDEIVKALDPVQYADHPALVDLPDGATLEGYLYPDSFQRSSTTELTEIVRLALDEFASSITPELTTQLDQAHGLNLHEAVILASIVEREVSAETDRTKVAQVFLKRYKIGMQLGSDPTALYGALLFGLEPSVSADTPYNTRLYTGLPPGPINTVSASSLKAIAYPADTDYLYFVSGDDGNTYFSRSLSEHEALTAQHCIELCKSY